MPIPPHDPVVALSRLATDIADVTAGYAVMEERADAELQVIAQRLHALHDAHAARLLTALEEIGGHPEDAGSVMGAVHRAVATGLDWFGALDASVLPRIVNGERRLLDAYDRALDALQPGAGLHEMVREQRAAIAAQVEALSAG